MTKKHFWQKLENEVFAQKLENEVFAQKLFLS
jgi:hypothetical protein